MVTRAGTFITAVIGLVLGAAISIAHAGDSGTHSSTESFSLLSYNIRIDFDGTSWGRRKNAVRDYLAASSPDLVAIQEASELMIEHYRQFLPAHGFIIGNRSDGGQGDQGWYEFLPIFFRQDRLEALDMGSFWVSDTPDVPGSNLANTKFHGRVLTWVKLKDRRTNQVFALANVHTHGQRASDAFRIIRDEVKARTGDVPVIYAGDFNFEPTNVAYAEALDPGLGRLLDSAFAPQRNWEQHPGPTTIGPGQGVPDGPEGIKAGKVGRRIDYVFVDSAFNPISYHVEPVPLSPGLFASDHFAVQTTIQWQANE